MHTIAVTLAMAALCAPGAAAEDHRKPRVLDQQGRVLTDSDHNGQTRKAPSAPNAAGTTLKRGIISRDAAIERRKALKPLTERVDTRGLRTTEAAYAEALRKWAVRQDDRLLELQKIHTAYGRLKSYRDRAAGEGEDTSRIDPRLKGMEKKMAALSGDIRKARVELQELAGRYQAELTFMSHMMKSRHDTAKAVLQENPKTEAKERKSP